MKLFLLLTAVFAFVNAQFGNLFGNRNPLGALGGIANQAANTLNQPPVPLGPLQPAANLGANLLRSAFNNFEDLSNAAADVSNDVIWSSYKVSLNLISRLDQ
jgi:hypothetical protein